ncbi:diguanylate cyclase [Paracoccus nototheniae]|uniref:diguanylate cyclase n=1 Tax=Paracoccus nototheniae TaxID=2489002 RepID=A0ABW4DZM0_9RHOB|nr:diguanylate cyclase [Paracoccus nototheniae]
MYDPFLILADTLGVMALCTIFYSLVQKRITHRGLRHVSVGLAFGAAAIIVMLQPVELGPGIQTDARGAFVGMAMAFGGPLAAFVAVCLAVVARLLIGGEGAIWGSGLIVTTALFAGIWYAAYNTTHTRGRRAWVLLSVASTLPTFLAFVRFRIWDEQQMIFITLLTAILIFVFGKMLETEQRRGRRERELAMAAATDALTGLPNRRALDAYTRELEESGADDVMLLLLDVDHFKQINDEYGHDEGDRVLHTIAQAITRTIRGGDFAARIGGEEFAVIVRTSGFSTGHQVAERFRQAVQVPYGDPAEGRVSTISVGGFCFDGKPFSYINGYRLADLALYQSKADGRNRATVTPLLQAA